MTKLQKHKLEQAHKLLTQAIDHILDVRATADPKVDFSDRGWDMLNRLADEADDFAANSGWILDELTT